MQSRTWSVILSKMDWSSSAPLHAQSCSLARTSAPPWLGPVATLPYLLGLLAMIKCSICSYQRDSWYVSNWRLACHNTVWQGGLRYSLAGLLPMLQWHCTLPHAATLIMDLIFACQHNHHSTYKPTFMLSSSPSGWRQGLMLAISLPSPMISKAKRLENHRGHATNDMHPCGRGNSSTSDA